MINDRNGKPIKCCYCGNEECERLGGSVKCTEQTFPPSDKYNDMNYHSTDCPKCGHMFEGLRHPVVSVCPKCGFKYDISKADVDLLMKDFEKYLKSIEVH